MGERGGGAMAGSLVLLLFPLLISTPFTHALPSLLSELDASKPRHSHLHKSALERQTSAEQQAKLWLPLANQGWKPCVRRDSTSTPPEKSEGYIQVFLDGGLNQQRMGVCDAVALAKILNATLIIPHLEVNPVWQDSSTFMDIFDVDHFINVLKDDISIVKEVYGGEARISALRSLFPLMEDKKSLASSEERALIKGKASLLATVDYHVSMHSDIFISASPGNMHNAVEGHRMYENKKTIRPNMALLGKLLLKKNLSWVEFKDGVVEGHENRQGLLRLRKPNQSIYTYPAPDCMCNA